VPPALVAILGVGLLVYLLGLPPAPWATWRTSPAACRAGAAGCALEPETLKHHRALRVLMAMVGLLETLLTLNLTDEITESRGFPDRECVALGAANMVSGLFGGMGGCAMIGQTVINLSSGGRGRLSGGGRGDDLAVRAVSVAADRAHSAGGAGRGDVRGVPADLCLGVAAGAAKVPLNDVLVIIAGDHGVHRPGHGGAVRHHHRGAQLRLAAGARVVCRCHEGCAGRQAYLLHGTLFFASTTSFLNQFDPANDPAQTRWIAST
jgi:SulP family sulfate permease